MRIFVFTVIALSASTAWAQNPPQPGFYVDSQVLWFDSRINDDFELAPRYVFGYDDAVGARVRYWSYDHGTLETIPLVGSISQRLDLDVIDLEATTHLRHGGSDFVFSGGARIAHIDVNNYFDTSITPTTRFEKSTMGGVTLAGEGRTNIVGDEQWGTAFVYGGRLSLLQGDWEGDDSSTLSDFELNVQNERFIVPEAFTGVEIRYGRAFTRLTVEMQDWQGSSSSNTLVFHKFGFTGYGVDVGWSF